MEIALLVGLGLAVAVPVALWRYYRTKYKTYKKLFETEQKVIGKVADYNKALQKTVDLQAEKIVEQHEELTADADMDELVELWTAFDDYGSN